MNAQMVGVARLLIGDSDQFWCWCHSPSHVPSVEYQLARESVVRIDVPDWDVLLRRER